jgi:hypothetical protein
VRARAPAGDRRPGEVETRLRKLRELRGTLRQTLALLDETLPPLPGAATRSPNPRGSRPRSSLAFRLHRRSVGIT